MTEIKPNFLIVGGAKAGTTSLHYYLCQHPNVYMPDLKEPCFFTTEKPDSEWVGTWEEYLKLFEDSDAFKWRGEASTPYLYYYEQVIPEIKSRLGTCKIIIMLRNPVRRAYSMYCHNLKHGQETLDFEAALNAENERIKDGWPAAFHYQKIGFVADAIEAYQNAFGKDNVGIFSFDDMKSDTLRFMQKIYGFLDIPPADIPDLSAQNPSGVPKNPRLYNFLHNKGLWKEPIKLLTPYKWRQHIKERVLNANLEKRPMPAVTKTRLQELYKDEILALEALTGQDLSHWRAI